MLPLLLAGCAPGTFNLTGAGGPAKKQEEAKARTEQAPAPVQLPGPQITVQPMPSLTAPPGAEAAPVKLGLLLPLSGDSGAASLGRDLLDAATLALFEVGGPRVELLPHDTKGTPEGAQAAIQSALQEGAQLILGPLLRTSVTAVADVAQERKVPVIAFSSDETVARPGVYLLSFTPQQEVRRAVGYAVSRGMQRFAALAPRNDYGETVVAALREALQAQGLALERVNYYPPGGEDAESAVKALARYDERHQAMLVKRRELAGQDGDTAKRRLAQLERRDTYGDAGLDAIVLPEGGQTLRAVAPLLPYYDINLKQTRLIGTGRWDDPTVGREPALVGGWFAGATRQPVAAFRQRFNQHFGRAPSRLASLAYDATALAAALTAVPAGPDFRPETLTDPNGYAGVNGLFRFRQDGRAERGLAVLAVERDGFRVVAPAPASFRELVN
ncbi:MAG TPA: penicillin-binding protein activator [Alphaproteobacteria bacterium]|nr:penicillin-binding protein activator [Alphaproteobacteria bacterium]